MYPHILHVPSIRNMRVLMRPKNGHISGPMPFPKMRI